MSEIPIGSPWSRSERVATATFAGALLTSLFFLVHPWYDATPDGALYLATARSLAAGEGYTYLGEPFRVRPPGFSLLIAPWAGVPPDFRALHLLVGLFGAAGVLFLALLLRPRVGTPLALAIGACVWLNPAYRLLCNQVMSDVPGTTLVLLCLLLERRARSGAGLWRWALLGVAVGGASLVRSIALLLVPASAVSLLWQARSGAAGSPRAGVREIGVLALATAAAVLPWTLRNAGLPEGPAHLTRIHSYSVAMWRADPSDPSSARVPASELLARVPRRSVQTLSTLGSRLQAQERGDLPLRRGIGAGHLGFATALLLGLLVQGLRRRDTAELFAALCLGVVLVYFGFSWRLLLPVYLIALAAAVETLREGLRRLAPEPTPTLACLAALLALLVVDLPGGPRAEHEAEHRRLEEFAASVEAAVGTRDVVAATSVTWAAFVSRPVYNLRPLVRRGATPESLEAFFERYGVDTVVILAGDALSRPAAELLRAHHGEPERAGEARLWRVRPGASERGGPR
ncbi:MAG: glycosyltransferase family 39 protein [Myxococcota bacterium]|nr:glycosyltransferase family 39 protein [Myxococcota bacterium]